MWQGREEKIQNKSVNVLQRGPAARSKPSSFSRSGFRPRAEKAVAGGARTHNPLRRV